MKLLPTLFLVFALSHGDGNSAIIYLIDGGKVQGQLVETDPAGYLLRKVDGTFHHISYAATKELITSDGNATKVKGVDSKTSTTNQPASVLALPKLPLANQKVLEFCERNEGKRVGNGVCSVLALEGLNYAGINTSHYGWGRKLKENEPWLPGDVLQYINIELRGDEYWYIYHLHTAVVAEVSEDYIAVFEQNTPPNGQVVQRFEISTNASWSALPWAFRPVLSELERNQAEELIRSKVVSGN